MQPVLLRPGIRPIGAAVSIGSALLFLAACEAADTPGPEFVLTGGVIYADAGAEPVAALAIEGDRIVALGSDAEIRLLAVDDTQEMPLDGAVVIPGFVDAWIDLEALGRDDRLDLTGTATPREIQARLRAAAGSGDGWLVGFGWDETIWPRRESPTVELVDAAVADRPLLLYRRAGRVAWINTAAMRAAEARGQTVSAAAGSATGLVSGAALTAIESLLDTPRDEIRSAWMAAGARAAAAAGITRVLTAPVDRRALTLLSGLARGEDLPIRVDARLAVGSEPGSRDDPQIDVIAVGVEADGPLSLRLAALTEPYADAATPGPPPELGAACEQARRLGLPLHVHAYGDAALVAASACGATTMVVGADVLPAGELPADLRVAVTPLRLAHDLYWLADRLGSERAQRAHAYRDLATARSLRGMASRAPEYPLAPMRAVGVINRRQDLEGYPLDGWQPTQRLTISDALQAAFGAFLVDDAGTLAAGEAADLVIWSEDPFAGPEAIGRAQAMVVIVAGRVVFSRPLVELPMERR